MTVFNLMQADLEITRKVLWLIKEDYVFLSSLNDDTDKCDEGIYPAVSCSDLFAPAADCVKLEEKDLDFYAEVVKKFGYTGSMAWCSIKKRAKLWRREGKPWEKEFDEAVVSIKEMMNQVVHNCSDINAN